jgi:hypothetical protein
MSIKIFKPFLVLIVLVAAACSYDVQGQNSMPSVSSPIAHISAPQQTLIVGNIPATINLGSQQQSVQNSQYQAGVKNAGPSLWIQGDGGWIQYAAIPQGSTVTLIAVSPTGGSGILSEMLNGTTYNYNFYFYSSSQLTFLADAIGQHVLSFNANGQTSNQVTINVIAYVPPQYCPTPYNYPVSGYYSRLHYPGYEYVRQCPRCYSGHKWYDSDYPWLNAP